MRLFYTTILCLLLLLAPSCDNDFRSDQLPIAFVYIELNVNDLRYLDLHNKGFVYLPGGLRGILLYKKSPSEYIAFERNCTFEFENPCSVVEMHPSLFYMVDPCCESTFDLDGNPSGGPARNPLRTYFTFLEGNLLIIQSEPF